jgi:hypothetical protein
LIIAAPQRGGDAAEARRTPARPGQLIGAFDKAWRDDLGLHCKVIEFALSRLPVRAPSRRTVSL